MTDPKNIYDDGDVKIPLDQVGGDASKEETEESTEPVEAARMSDEELLKFVMGYCDRQLFTNLHLRDQRDLGMVFLPVAVGGLGNVIPESVGLIWEWYENKGYWGVNGQPTFVTARLMHVEDWKRAHKAILEEKSRRLSVKL